MGIKAGYVVPHPPLIIPSVGRGEEQGIAQTISAYKEVARRTVALCPETIVVSSPHVTAYRDGFHVTSDTTLSGDMDVFGAPQTQLEVGIDTELSQAIIEHAQRNNIVTAPSSWRDQRMDHATFIPLYFIEQAYREAGIRPNYRLVRVGLSGLSADIHRSFGRVIAEAIEVVGRSCVFVASGDLSHKLKADGPYGFASEGPKLDKGLCDLFEQGNLGGLFELDKQICDSAAECGVRSFQIMAGALEEISSTKSSRKNASASFHASEKPLFGAYQAELLSYEGPFGVGYAVAAFERFDAASSGDFGADPYVRLACASIETYLRTGKPLELTDEWQNALPDEMLLQQAGVFVSIHKNGELRGCIGTIVPTTSSIAQEIIQNGISASTRDPRFPAIQVDELDCLEVSVDVLTEPEPINSEADLDPCRYGVVVTKGYKRGLLLPDLEGVDSVAQQVAIAKQKAGIRVDDYDVQLERFEVIRHEAS